MVRPLTKNKLGLVLILAATTALSGCGSLTLFNKDKPVVAPQQPTEASLVLSAIQASAAQIRNSVSQMTSARQTTYKKSSVSTKSPHNDLNKKIDVTWPGAMDDITRMIAMQVGWTCKTVGTVPSNRPIVYIKAVQESAYSILRDIGLQSGSRAGITIDAKQKLIVISFQGA